MNKIIFYAIAILLLCQSYNIKANNTFGGIPNFIDSINTTAQLKELISKIDSSYMNFRINERLEPKCHVPHKNYKKIMDSLNVQTWAKADFDNNGLTDILIIGGATYHTVLVILDKGDKYESKFIVRPNFRDCTFPVLQGNTIKLYFDSKPQENAIDLQYITLAYNFGEFVEKSETSATYKIKKIEYFTQRCYGFCPIFSLTINADKSATWLAERFNKINEKDWEGTFHTTITDVKFNELIDLLNYIDFPTLENNYSVNWTDDQTAILKITYDDDKIKIIRDYGLLGTFGLSKIHQLLFELRENQSWVK